MKSIEKIFLAAGFVLIGIGVGIGIGVSDFFVKGRKIKS